MGPLGPFFVLAMEMECAWCFFVRSLARCVTMSSMFTLFLIGNIASGKSSAARYLERRGALRIDLDTLAKRLYTPGSQVVNDIVDAFGWDVLDEFGALRTDVLAQRAFDVPEHARLLDSIVHPVLLERLGAMLLPSNCCSVVTPRYELAVVEISVPETFTDAFGLADEVLAITAPFDVRRDRALARGMSQEDFEARALCQPDEDSLCALADTVFDNYGDEQGLITYLDAWLRERGLLQGGER